MSGYNFTVFLNIRRAMTEKEIINTYGEICHNLSGRRLKPAFSLLWQLISDNGLGMYQDECRELEQNYHYMLKYTVEGINDPERQKVYRHLIVSVFELADKVNETLLLKLSQSAQYQEIRNFGNRFITDTTGFLSEMEEYYSNLELQELAGKTFGKNKGQDEIAVKHQKRMVNLFYHAWFRDKINSGEAAFFNKITGHPQLLPSYRALIVTGLSISLFRYFDATKFSLLFDACESDEPEVKQRAFVGLMACFFKYDSRLQFYPSLTGRLELLNEDPGFKQNLQWIILQLIRTKETEKIQQKIRDEIIPEMIRISPNLKNKINLDSLMDEGLTDDKNPEWKEIFRDSPGLIDKMEEFSELQMEGADVFMGSFAMLKSFPFFNEFANWFIPFFIDNPDIGSEIDVADPVNRKFLDMLSIAPILCNSDKHSFCLSLKNITGVNRGMLVDGMKAEMDQYTELDKEEELSSPGKAEEYVSNQYIQDLYRFYRLHPRKADFEDIFGWRFDFHNTRAVGNILKEDIKILRNIGEYYFSKNHFTEASEIFTILLETEKKGELYQKIAFCQQKLGDFRLALENYLKADLYEHNKLWNLKKVALCYRNLKEPARALEYYRHAESLDPENLSIQLSIGHCLLELEKYDEALKSYFKVEYLAPGNKKVWRPIGWCSFLTGKKKQAEKYFKKLIDDTPTKHDLMNMGHVQWSLGNRKEALDFYKKSITEGGFSEEEFISVFDEDLHHLVAQGINKDDVPIMLDHLRYSLEE